MVWGCLKHVTLVIGVVLNIIITQKKKKTHNVRYLLFGGKTRTVAQETAPHIALRDGSREAGEARSGYKILVKDAFMPSSTDFTKGFLLVTE